GMLILLAGIFIYATRSVVAPLVIAFLLAYLLHPLVSRLERWTRMPRLVAVLLVYLVLILLLAGATTGVGLAIAQQLVGIVRDLSALVGQLPAYLERLS
ncbi:MAG: AI-2E family transporter, partial [Anaerolineae bacterium]|nr:AI-2E family transporter [Anaerolineae bacterium]